MVIFTIPQLKNFFNSDDVTEVMINAWNKIFVEHNGIIVQTAAQFPSEQVYLDCVEEILKSNHTSSKNKYHYDGSFSNGHRYNITLAPVSAHGPILTIRKHAQKTLSLSDLVTSHFMNDKAALFLKAAVEHRLNIIISGGTGSGKTSFLNTLSSLIPSDQRVVSIEDTLELKSTHPNWLHLKTIDDSDTPFTARHAVKNSLRMRPDRILVGECRGSEAYDMLQAMSTGHDGSMTTIHANSAQECLFRLENLINLGHPELPIKLIRQQMTAAIHLIIQIKRHANGFRQVTEILELTGMNNDTITRAPIFAINDHGYLDVLNYVPDSLNQINKDNTVIPSYLFDTAKPLKKAN